MQTKRCLSSLPLQVLSHRPIIQPRLNLIITRPQFLTNRISLRKQPQSNKLIHRPIIKSADSMISKVLIRATAAINKLPLPRLARFVTRRSASTMTFSRLIKLKSRVQCSNKISSPLQTVSAKRLGTPTMLITL